MSLPMPSVNPLKSATFSKMGALPPPRLALSETLFFLKTE